MLFMIFICLSHALITSAANIQFLVKRYTMERLGDMYRTSCTEQSNGGLKVGEYDWIIGKILKCIHDRDLR